MICHLCQKESDAYFGGSLPEGTRVQVEEHLTTCAECTKIYQLDRLAYDVIHAEKGQKSNPFLVTRIMAGIGELEQRKEHYITVSIYQRLFKSALITGSLAAAMAFGVMVGNLYKSEPAVMSIPDELAYLNDAALESVDLFSIE